MFKLLLQNFIKKNGRSPNAIEMLQLKFKAASQANKGQVLPFKQKRDFAAEIQAMVNDGTLKMGEVTKKNDNVLRREMFKNSNLNKPTVEGQMEKITGASNKIKEIQKEIDQMYKPKSDAEIKAKYDKQNKEAAERLRKKQKEAMDDMKEIEDPEEFAKGGRIGFRYGKFVLDKVIAKLLSDKNKVKQAVDDIFPTGDYKYDAQMAAEALVENNPKVFGGKLMDELDDVTYSEVYGAVLEPIQKNMALMRELKKASKPTKTLESIKKTGTIDISDDDVASEFARFMKETSPDDAKKIEQTVELANFDPKKVKGNAEGGRIGYYTGGITDVEPSLDDIGHGSDSLMSRTRLMSPGAQATTSTGLNYLLAEDNDNLRIPFSGGGGLISSLIKNFMRATGRKPTSNEITKMQKVFFENAEKKVDDAINSAKTPFTMSKDEYAMNVGGGYKAIGRRMDDEAKRMNNADKDSILRFIQEHNIENRAEGGRIGFSGGGGRRAFLKFLASIGGLTAAAKSGILSLGGKEATKKAVTETVKKAAGSGQPPPYFFKLVDKIRTLGDDTLATQDKAIAKKYKDYVMEEDFAGNIEIIKKSDDIAGNKIEDVYMKYTVDEVPTKVGKRGSAKVEEYEEFTARPDAEGKMKDIEQGVPDEVVQEGTMFEDNMTEFGKADGGRIGFSGGNIAKLLAGKKITGSSRGFLEKVFGKERFANMIENDPDLHRGLLEVVEMFRAKDKEGLKMYLQKFLPHMDDEMIEDFIVGGEGTEGIEGQLIRLGSGRDYAGKIEMMKKADNMRKLKNFDIEGVSKNAEGGRIEMRGGGDALKAIIQFFANKAGKKGSTFLKDINPKALPQGIENIMGPEHMKMLKENQTGYLESLLSIIKSDKQFLDNVNNRVKDMVKTAPEGFEDVAENIANQMVKSSMKDSRFERMKVYDKIDIDEAILDVEQMIKNRRVKESDGRALNASGGLQTMLGE